MFFNTKDNWHWMIDNQWRISERIDMSLVFDDYLSTGIDAVMTINNPLYDGFNEFDSLYIFKGIDNSEKINY